MPGKPKAQGSKLVRHILPIQIKAAADKNGVHTFDGLSAVWDKDLGNDIIHKGAFKATIADWKNSPDAMPLLNSHNQWDIFSALGQATDLKETSEGLQSSWELLPGEEGDRVFTRLQPSPTTGKALIGKMSIGFIPTKYSYEQPEGTDSYFDRIRHITEAELKEVSLVLFPMAPGAAIDASSVKSFMLELDNTDGAKLTLLEAKELRRLNTKIGLLLSRKTGKQEPAGEEGGAEEEPTPPAPESKTDLEEVEDGGEGTTATPPVETPEVEVPETPKTPEPEPAAPAEKAYKFPEALSDRLGNVLARRRVSDVLAGRREPQE